MAQHTWALILNVTNQVEYYAQKNRRGGWSSCPDFCYWDQPLHELAGKTLGIVGLGHIGMRVAKIAHDFGMDVFAVTSKNRDDLPAGIQKTTLQGLLGVSDILTLHCPLTADTHHLINEETLQAMRPGAILVNTGRGPLVDEDAVARALHEGTLGAYCADVMATEPPAADNPLLKEPHAYLTPHIAWATVEARQRLINICIDNLRAFINGEPINRV